MDDLLRFPSAVRRDPRIEAWFSGVTDPLRLVARPWFERMRRCGADVRELLHDGCPLACVRDAPFGYVNAFKAHANVGLFRGATFADPAGSLEGAGKRMRHVKVRPGVALDENALSELIADAYFAEMTAGRELEIETAFAADQDNRDLSRWLYNSTPEAPGDLGYWVGYRIVRSYYERAPDKRRAVRDILQLVDAKAFLAASAWRPGMQLGRLKARQDGSGLNSP